MRQWKEVQALLWKAAEVDADGISFLALHLCSVRDFCIERSRIADMKITLKDGSIKEYGEPKSVFEIAKDISEGLARVACAGEVDGKIVDLRTEIAEDCTLNIVTLSDAEGLKVLRHTASHVLAQAVKRLRPNAKVTIGPAIEDGFYYDFDTEPLESLNKHLLVKQCKFNQMRQKFLII